jgi:hypothetical protein
MYELLGGYGLQRVRWRLLQSHLVEEGGEE